jgi:CRP-like cAMP-binding protein
MDKIEVLRKSDIFHAFTENNLRTIDKMCTTEVFDPGAIIFRQGKEAEKLYVVEEGLVSIILEMGPTDKRQIQSASESECFGWTATIHPYCRLCMAQAVEKTKVLVFDGKELRSLFDTNPKLFAEIAIGLAYVISQRLSAAFTQLMGCTYQD